MARSSTTFAPGPDPRRNTKGRGRGVISLPDVIRRELASADENGIPQIVGIVQNAVKQARKPNGKAWADWLADRGFGKPREFVEFAARLGPDDLRILTTDEQLAYGNGSLGREEVVAIIASRRSGRAGEVAMSGDGDQVETG